jgi:hypothetical protein
VNVWGAPTQAPLSGIGITCAKPTLLPSADQYFIVNEVLEPRPFVQARGAAGSINYGMQAQSDCGNAAPRATWMTSIAPLGSAVLAFNAQCSASSLRLLPDNQLLIQGMKIGDRTLFAKSFAAPFPLSTINENACAGNECSSASTSAPATSSTR